MNRRTSILALLFGSCGLIVKAHQERQQTQDLITFSSDRVVKRWEHWSVTCPKTLTILDPGSTSPVVLTRAEILAALRSER